MVTCFSMWLPLESKCGAEPDAGAAAVLNIPVTTLGTEAMCS